MCKYLLCRTLLYDTSGIHYHYVIRHFCDNAQVMGDDHNGRIDPVFQISEKVKDLCLNGYVQSSRRLVSDDEFRIAGKSHGDHYTLSHTSG